MRRTVPHMMLAAFLINVIGYPANAQTCSFTEPASPLCDNPRVIPGEVGQHVVLMDANSSGVLGDYCGQQVSNVVYFEITPQADVQISLSTCHPATTYDTVMIAWAAFGQGCNMLVEVGCNDDTLTEECVNGCSGRGSTISFGAVGGTRYVIGIGAYGDNQAGCNLCLGLIATIGEPCGDAPTNLDCSLAKELPGSSGSHIAQTDVTDAFTLPSEPIPFCSGPPIGNSVWYTSVPEENGRIVATTCNSVTNYDTVMAMYSGVCGVVLNQVTCIDDSIDVVCANGCNPGAPRGSVVNSLVQKGDRYYFQVGSYSENVAMCGPRLCLKFELIHVPCPADVKLNGQVDAGDIAELLGFWGQSYDPADLDGNGIIGAGDLAAVIGNWGGCP